MKIEGLFALQPHTFDLVLSQMAVTAILIPNSTVFGVYAFGQGEPVLDPTDFFDIIIKAT